MSNNLYRGSAIPDTSWRLRSYTLDPQAQVVRNLTRFTPFLYSPYAKSLCDGLNVSTAFTNPYADGQPFTGTFYGVARTEGTGEDDRSLTIVQTLVPNKGEDKSVTWAENCKELRTIRYVERLTKAQLDIETATYAACSNGNNYMLDINRTDDGLWTLKVMIRTAQPVAQAAFTSLKAAMQEDETYREINKATQAFDTTRSQGEILRMTSSINEFCYYDLERVKATSIAATLDAKTLDSALEQETAKVYRNSRTQIAAVASSQGNIYQAQQTPNADGTYDGNVAYRQSAAAVMQFASERTAFKAEDSVVYKNARTQIDAPATTGSGIYRADQSFNQDGTYDGKLTYRRGTNTGVVTFESENSALQEEDRTLYRDWNAKVDAPASTQGTVYTATNELTEDGLYNAAIGYQRNNAAVMQFASERTLFKAEDSILYKSSRTQLDAPTAAGSGIYRADQSLNQDGTYDGKLVYRHGTNTGAVSFESQNAALQEEDRILYKDWNSKVDAPAAPQGAVYTAANDMTEDGLYNASIGYQQNKAATLSFASERTLFKAEDSILYKSSRTQIEASAVAGSGVYRADQSMNEDGTYDGRLTYRHGTNTGTVSFESQNAALQEEDRILYRDWNAKIDAPAAGVGSVYTATNELTEDGLYNASIGYQKNVAANVVANSMAATLQANQTTLYKSNLASIAVPVAVQGVVYDANQALNTDGTYDGKLVSQTSVAAAVDTVSLSSALQSDTTKVYKNSRTSIATPAAAAGTIYNAAQSLNTDGTYDGNLVYRESNAAQLSFTSERTAFKVEDSVLYKNSRTKVDVPASIGSGVYRADQSMNEDGTYDGRLTYRRGTNAGAISFESENATLQEEDRILYRDWLTKIDAPAATPGNVYTASNELTEDGLYNASIGYQRNTAATSVAASMAATLRTDNTTLYKNNLSEIAVPAAVQGVVYDATQALNTDGTYDGKMGAQTSVAASVSVTSLAATLRTDADTLYKNSRSVLVTPAAVAGVVYRSSQTFNTDGTYDGQVGSQTAVAATRTIMTEQMAGRTTTTDVRRNQTTAIAAPGAGIGEVYRATSTFNVDGTFDGNLDYEKAINLNATTQRVQSGLVSETELIDNNRATKLDAPAAPQGTVYQASNELKQDGTFNSRLEDRVSNEVSMSFKSEQTPFKDGRKIVYENSRTMIEAPVPIVGVYRANQTINQDGTYSGDLVYINTPPNATPVIFESVNATLTEENRAVYRDWASKLDAPASSQGTIYEATNRMTDDGLYEGSVAYRINHAGSVPFQSETMLTRTENQIVYSHSRTVIAAPAFAVPGVYRATNSVNEDGTYSGTLTYDKSSPASVEFASERSLFRSEDTIIYESNVTAISAPTPTGPGIYAATQALNADGTYSGKLVYRQSANSAGVIFESANASLMEENRAIYRDHATKLDAPASSQGIIYEATNRLTDDGLYEGNIAYRANHAGTVPFQAEATVTRTENQIVYSHSRTVIAAPAFAAPGVYRATNSINEDGTYNGALTYNQSSPATVAFASERSLFRVEDTLIYESSAGVIVAPSPAGPGIYAATQVLNPDGTYNGKLVYRQPVTGTGAEFESVNSTLEEQSRIVYKNAAAPITAAASSVGVIYQAANTISEDGTYDAAMTYAASKLADHTFAHTQQALRTETMRMYRNSTTPLAGVTPTAGFTYTVNQTFNQDGTYDGSLVYGAVTTLQPVVDGMRSVTGARFDQVYVGQTAVPVLPTPGSGGIYKASVNVSTDGTYEGRMMYEQNTAFSVPFDKGRGPLIVENAILYRHWPTKIESPTGVASTVYDAHQTLEDDGTYSGLLTSTASVLWTDYKYRFPVYHPNASTDSIYQEVYCINSWDLSQVVAFLNEASTGGPNLDGTGIHMGNHKWVGTRVRNIASYA